MGTALGSTMAPRYADSDMADLKDKLLNSLQQKPSINTFPFVDEIFIMWTKWDEKYHSPKQNIDYSSKNGNFLNTRKKFSITGTIINTTLKA